MADRIIIADDHPLFRAALNHAVAKVWPEAEIVEAASAAQATNEAKKTPGATCQKA